MKVRRKIMALGTALAMAFVMIASLVMVTDVKADGEKKITAAVVNFTAPAAGTKVTLSKDEYDMTQPSVRPTLSSSTEGVDPREFQYARFVTDETGQEYFEGTFEAGKTYYMFFDLMADYTNNYSFDDNLSVQVKGADKSNVLEVNPNSAPIVASFTIPKSGGGDQGGDADQGGNSDQTPAASTTTSTVTTLTDGASATLNPAADGTVSFRIEKDFEYFQNGGKLFIDGQEVPSDQYYATPGSTIITLVKEYASKLSDGLDHAVKVVFNNGEEFNATIKVAAASSDGTAANGTSGTASSTAATTTKVTSPKTADVLPIAGIALVFVGATAIGVIAFRRKNS